MPSLCAIEIHPLTALTHRAMVVWAVSFSEEWALEKAQRAAGLHFFIFMQKAPSMFSHESPLPLLGKGLEDVQVRLVLLLGLCRAICEVPLGLYVKFWMNSSM